MLRIGVIGYGYWGPNLVRNFMESAGAQVTWVSDMIESRLAQVKNRYPSIKTTTNFNELLTSKEVDAVAIATPVSTHFDLAMAALLAGKHVLVEKPLSDSSKKAKLLIEEASRRNLILMVDHTFPFTGAVRKIQELVSSGQLGDIYYYDSVRVNLGLFQHDVNVLWDLAVHDLSILDFIFTEKPVSVSATGIKHVPGKPENVAYLTLFFEQPIIAHIHVNWLSPVKLRQTLIGGSQKMILYDDIEPTEKIKIYDKGITFDNDPKNIYEMRVGYRSGDMWCPKLDGSEALGLMAKHFLHCIQTGEKPITNADSGLRIVRILEAATESMSQRGSLIELNN